MADTGRWAARARTTSQRGGQGRRSGKSKLKFLYPDDMPLWEKIRTIARKSTAPRTSPPTSGADQLKACEGRATANYRSASPRRNIQLLDQSRRKGAPSDHVFTVREVRLSAGAEFVVAICGDIMTMPGLPKVPAADAIDIGAGRQDRGAVLDLRRVSQISSDPLLRAAEVAGPMRLRVQFPRKALIASSLSLLAEETKDKIR